MPRMFLSAQAELQEMVEDRIKRSVKLNKAAFDGADEKQLFDELRHDTQLEYAQLAYWMHRISILKNFHFQDEHVTFSTPGSRSFNATMLSLSLGWAHSAGGT